LSGGTIDRSDASKVLPDPSFVLAMRYVLLLLPLFVVAASCRRDKGECPNDRMCTMEFRTITVEVRDSMGGAVVLDSVRTVRITDGRVFRFVALPGMPQSLYVVITDAEMSEVNTRGVLFRFEGFREDSALAVSDFLIRHDCCHVEKLSGPTVITWGQ
jgi:hypothetical protein